MPTFRFIYQSITFSDDFNSMPDDFTRLLWTLMPLALDREGRGKYSPAWLRSMVFPERTDVTIEKVQDALDWYEDHGMINVYGDGKYDRKYFHIPTWHKYQSTKKEAQSRFPEPPGYETPESPEAPDLDGPEQGYCCDDPECFDENNNSGVTPDLLQTYSGVSPELVQTYSGTEKKRKENKRQEKINSPPFGGETSQISPKSHSRQKKPIDERSNAPAIQAFRDATRKFPRKILYDKVIAVLGENPDVEKLREAFETWNLRGFNPENIGGILEWYQNGIPPWKNGNGTGKSTTAAVNHDAIEAVRRKLTEDGGIIDGECISVT